MGVDVIHASALGASIAAEQPGVLEEELEAVFVEVGGRGHELAEAALTWVGLAGSREA